MQRPFLLAMFVAAALVVGCKPSAQPKTEGLSSLKVQSGGDLPQLELSAVHKGEKQKVESATAEAVSHTSPFFQLCTGDVLGLSFPESLVVPDSQVTKDPVNQKSGETIVGPFDMGGKPQMWATRIRKYRCTGAELDAMLRDLHDKVAQMARERDCRVINEPNYEFMARSDDFNVTYTLGEWHGAVAVHSRKIDPALADGEPAVYSVDFNVHETYVPPRKNQGPK